VPLHLLENETGIVADRKPLGVRRGVLRRLLVGARVGENEVVETPIVYHPDEMLRGSLPAKVRGGLPGNQNINTDEYGESLAEDY
jgi:hypothetical protein